MGFVRGLHKSETPFTRSPCMQAKRGHPSAINGVSVEKIIQEEVDQLLQELVINVSDDVAVEEGVNDIMADMVHGDACDISLDSVPGRQQTAMHLQSDKAEQVSYNHDRCGTRCYIIHTCLC